jgi:hypothetical protein
MIGARDTKEMRSNRCVRLIENRDEIKRNRNTEKNTNTYKNKE